MEHFRLEEVAPGVHVAIATARGHGLCNAGLIDLGGGSVVFDAMLTPQAGAALGEAARRLLGRPVDYLVNSHYHGDHVRGNGALGARHIVSTHTVRSLVIERAAEALASDRVEAAAELEGLRSGRIPARPDEREVYEGWYEGILSTPADWRVAPPDLTFSDELTVRGSRREARILTFGGGHTSSDVLLYLPDEKMVFLGDLLSIGFHPCLWDGNPAALARTLERIRALPIDRALPGHGPVGGPRDLARMAEYLDGLRSRARERRRAGTTDPPPEPPAPYDAWAFASFYRLNLEFIQRVDTERAEPAPVLERRR